MISTSHMPTSKEWMSLVEWKMTMETTRAVLGLTVRTVTSVQGKNLVSQQNNCFGQLHDYAFSLIHSFILFDTFKGTLLL